MTDTPVYGWPYQTNGDRPNGPALGAGLALAAEGTVAAIDTRLMAAEATIASLVAGVGPRFYSADVPALTVAASALTLTGIPTTLRDVRLRIRHRGTQIAGSLGVFMRVNNDSSANYHTGGATGNGYAGTLDWAQTVGQSQASLGASSAAASTADWFSYTIVEFLSWDTAGSDLGYLFHNAANEFGDVKLWESAGGRYTVAGPYNRVDVFPSTGNWDVGSEMTLIGQYR